MKNTSLYSKNIAIDYLFTLTRRFNTISGFWMIFIASKGLGLVWLGSH